MAKSLIFTFVLFLAAVAAKDALLQNEQSIRPSHPTSVPGRNCLAHLAEVQATKASTIFPKCEADGTYSARQLLENSVVQCVSKGGEEIIRGTGIQACECHRLRHEAREKGKRGIVGHFTPSCDDTTGRYSPRQFHGSTGFSWCVDQEGNQIGEKIRGRPAGC
ncbi:hypothetical protein BV898_15869 [Hypsibius exemplaris]|uniref:Thyroglobulin type-1 domain-containing protein n=1 Tax=Hypsibius exemplaris TaxID=2072580 RepID=A0A9X6NKY8_HYPEX|nr:hypothetical protein BV898_15869 [Hypsibius exemplaris]